MINKARKSLKALKHIPNFSFRDKKPGYIGVCYDCPVAKKNIDVISQALDQAEKNEKVLEIIKAFAKGRFTLHERKTTDDQGNYDCVHFISFKDKNSRIQYPILKKQYDLLKEIFQ